MDEAQWRKEEIGKLCTDSDNVANWRATVLKFCGDTNMCTPEIMKSVEELSAKMTAMSAVAKKVREEAITVTKIDRTLRNGDTGPDVELLQKALDLKIKMLGLTPDKPGYFGYSTFKAVQVIQASKGLKPDGVVGPKTIAVIQLPAEGNVGGGMFEGKGQTIIPFAIQMPKKMKTKGVYSNGYPKGVLVHTTEGQWETLEHGKSVINDGANQGYAYLLNTAQGQLLQAHPVNQWGNHGGTSGWKSLVGAVSDDLIGIENLGPGRLTKQADGSFKTYFGKTIIPEKHGTPRFVTEKEYGCPAGWYLPFTQAQEENLVRTILWLYRNDPGNTFSMDHVLGHHEVSGIPGIGYWRKQDPGGALSMPMADFRERLKKLV